MTTTKTPIRRALTLFGVAALLTIGPACGWRTQPVLSVGPHQLPPDELLGRIDTALSARGYQHEIDRQHGIVTVRASYAHRGSPSTFTIQCYANGWLAVRMNGGYVRIDGDEATVPKALRTEYQTLVIMLRETVGVPAGEA
jgi:hypothetical protein